MSRLRSCRSPTESVLRGAQGRARQGLCALTRGKQVSLPQLPVTDILFFVNFKR